MKRGHRRWLNHQWSRCHSLGMDERATPRSNSKLAPQFKPAPHIQTCPVLPVCISCSLRCHYFRRRTVCLARVPHCLTKLSQVDLDTMIRGTDIEAWLPRETWTKHNSGPQQNARFADYKVDCSQHSAVSAADATLHGVECPVCLGDISEGDLVSQFLCRHTLHFECANQWLTSRIRQGQAGTCPMCNFVVIAPVFGLIQNSIPQAAARETTQGENNRSCLQGLSRQLLSCLSMLCGGVTGRRLSLSSVQASPQSNMPPIVGA